MRLLLAAALCLLAVACTPTAAAPRLPETTSSLPVDLSAEPPANSIVRIVESIQTEVYDVEGDSAPEIRSSLNEGGPYSPGEDRVYDAITRWGVHTSFRYAAASGACSVQSATIEMVAVTVLPRLSESSRLSAQTQARFDDYLEALKAHEQGHVESVQRGIRALQAAIDASPAMVSCSELGAYLNALGDAYVDAMAAVDSVYDTETGHGKSQGAVFP